MPGIFWGLKFQARVFFWVCIMKLRRIPPSCTLRVLPLGKTLNPSILIPYWQEDKSKIREEK